MNKEIEENSVKGGEIGAIIDMMIIDISVAVLAKGYSQESAVTLAKNRVKRDKILASAEGGELTNEQREVWRKTRESDKATITNDWKYNQPEKYLMHIIKEMSREYKRATREGREPSSEKIEGLTNELEYYMTGLETTEDKRKLAEYLRQESQQAALKHLEPSVLEMVTGMLKAQGIVITQSENTNSRMDVAKEESLSESLEKDFNQMQKMKDILINKYKYQNSKTSLLDVLNGNDSIGQLMSIKRDGTSR